MMLARSEWWPVELQKAVSQARTHGGLIEVPSRPTPITLSSIP